MDELQNFMKPGTPEARMEGVLKSASERGSYCASQRVRILLEARLERLLDKAERHKENELAQRIAERLFDLYAQREKYMRVLYISGKYGLGEKLRMLQDKDPLDLKFGLIMKLMAENAQVKRPNNVPCPVQEMMRARLERRPGFSV